MLSLTVLEVAKIRSTEEGAVAMKTLCQICGIDVREISSKKSEERIERQRKSFMKDFDSTERQPFYPSETIVKEAIEFQSGKEFFVRYEYENYELILSEFNTILAFCERNLDAEMPNKLTQMVSKDAKHRAEKLAWWKLVQTWLRCVTYHNHEEIKTFYQALATCLKIQYNR